MKTLYTVAQPAEYRETILRSRFIGHLNPADSLVKAREFISSLSSKYRDSSHNCWAYAVGIENIVYHSSDAGEPPGTAGRPIEGVLQRNNLTNVVLTVTRYFGGSKLGIRGLIDAYTHIAEQTVKQARLQSSVMKDYFKIELPYKRLEKLKNQIRGKDAEIFDITYGKDIALTLCIKSSYNFKEYLDKAQSLNELAYDYIKSDVFL